MPKLQLAVFVKLPQEFNESGSWRFEGLVDSFDKVGEIEKNTEAEGSEVYVVMLPVA